MVSPETASLNTQEASEQERETPPVERVSESPEQQVENAFSYAESVVRENDPVAADTEFTGYQEEYVSRGAVQPEALAAANETIAPELSEIKAEEKGLLERLNGKLEKYRGLLAAFAFTAGVSAASAEGLDSVTSEAGRPDRPVSAVVDGRSDAEHYQAIREMAAMYRGMEKRIVEGKFENEAELMGFLRDVAGKYDGEMSALYGVDGFGNMKFIEGTFSLQQDSVSSASEAVMKKAKLMGISELRDVHTHPKKRVVDTAGYANSNVPPSLTDIRESAANSWSDQFDNPTASESSAYGWVPTLQSVVTEKGVWEYGADFSNPYMGLQRRASLRLAAGSADSEKFKMSKEDAEAYLGKLQVPDELVLKREERRLEDKGANPLFLKYSESGETAKHGGSIAKTETGFEYELTEAQMKLVAASPEEEPQATADFIRFCEDRGIKMKFTAFPEKITGATSVAEMVGSKETEVSPPSSVSDAGVPNEVVQSQWEADEAVANGTAHVASPEDIRRDMERARERAEEASFERGFRERDFASEAEVLAYLHEGALRFGKEFSTIYGVKRTGEIVKAVGEFGDTGSIFIPNADAIMKKLKALDMEKIQVSHTHPVPTMEKVFTEEYVSKLKGEGNTLDRMPPSLADIRSASMMYWKDLYDDPKSRSEEWWNAAKTENVVVDGGGVWKYRVDFYHPYIAKQREAAIDEVLNSKELGGKRFDRDMLRSHLETLSGPDAVVLGRAVEHIPKELSFSDMIDARTRGSVGHFADGDEYEYSNEQLETMAASPEKSQQAIDRYIAYCRERGIEISYTPFPKGE